jgi:hypothetical protein
MPIHKAFAKRIKNLWEGKDGRAGLPSPILHPIDCFKAVKQCAKARGSDHATGEAIAASVCNRVFNGPEMNILFCGIPFLIDFGVGYAQGKMKDNKPKAANATNVDALRAKFQPTPKSSAGLQNPNLPMPQMAPYAADASKLYQACVNADIDPVWALRFCQGEFTGRGDLAQHMSEDDLEKFMGLLTSDFQPVTDSQGSGSALRSSASESSES